MTTMGKVLHHLQEQGPHQSPIEVMTRHKDFNMMTVANAKGDPVDIAGESLITFSATAFREIEEGSDVWEFRTMGAADTGAPTPRLMYVRGRDILIVRSTPQVT